VLAIAAQYKVEAHQIGNVTRGEFCIQLNGQPAIRAAVHSLCQVWATALERALGSL